jgi:hypothetical protein
MASSLRRSDLQALAQAKLDDAVLLLSHRRFSNAYYLCGYAIELGLKACIARNIRAECIPDKDFIKGIHTHNYPALIGLAGLSRELKERQDESPDFSANWGVVAGWGPGSRYEAIDVYTSQLMLAASADEHSGVFPWIQRYW